MPVTVLAPKSETLTFPSHSALRLLLQEREEKQTRVVEEGGDLGGARRGGECRAQLSDAVKVATLGNFQFFPSCRRNPDLARRYGLGMPNFQFSIN